MRHILFVGSDRGPQKRKTSVPQLQKPRSEFDQRRKLSSSSHQKSNPDRARHDQEEVVDSSGSESYEALDDPWGKNSPLRRIRKMEKEMKTLKS